MHVGLAAFGKLVRNLVIAIEQRGVEIRILVNQDRTIAPIGRSNQAELAALLLGSEKFLLVARLDTHHCRFDPDLQEMHWILPRRVVLAVEHAGTGTHSLYISRPDHGTRAHAVLVFQFPAQHVTDDFHVAVRVGAKAFPGRDPVFIDHAKRAEPHLLRVVITGERESVKTLQPAVIGVAAFAAFPDCDHVSSFPACTTLAVQASMATNIGAKYRNC